MSTHNMFSLRNVKKHTCTCLGAPLIWTYVNYLYLCSITLSMNTIVKSYQQCSVGHRNFKVLIDRLIVLGQPLWVILCHFPDWWEKRGRRDEREGLGKKRKRNGRNKNIPHVPLPAARIACLAQLWANLIWTPRWRKIHDTFTSPNHLKLLNSCHKPWTNSKLRHGDYWDNGVIILDKFCVISSLVLIQMLQQGDFIRYSQHSFWCKNNKTKKKISFITLSHLHDAVNSCHAK